jgi:hypothetical protein
MNRYGSEDSTQGHCTYAIITKCLQRLAPVVSGIEKKYIYEAKFSLKCFVVCTWDRVKIKVAENIFERVFIPSKYCLS